ncbi:hypothetical protein ADUPG1_005493, partial [Aduncisulcus paluster]
MEEKGEEEVESFDFEKGSLVLLERKGSRPHKLAPLYQGPVRVVERRSPVVFRVEELKTGTIEDVHVKRMRPYQNDEEHEPEEVAAKEEEFFQVEKIVDHDTRDGKLVLRIRWKGYQEEDDTWEDVNDHKAGVYLTEYLKKFPKLLEEFP